jgi:hypothetical protein
MLHDIQPTTSPRQFSTPAQTPTSPRRLYNTLPRSKKRPDQPSLVQSKTCSVSDARRTPPTRSIPFIRILEPKDDPVLKKSKEKDISNRRSSLDFSVFIPSLISTRETHSSTTSKRRMVSPMKQKHVSNLNKLGEFSFPQRSPHCTFRGRSSSSPHTQSPSAFKENGQIDSIRNNMHISDPATIVPPQRLTFSSLTTQLPLTPPNFSSTKSSPPTPLTMTNSSPPSPFTPQTQSPPSMFSTPTSPTSNFMSYFSPTSSPSYRESHHSPEHSPKFSPPTDYNPSTLSPISSFSSSISFRIIRSFRGFLLTSNDALRSTLPRSMIPSNSNENSDDIYEEMLATVPPIPSSRPVQFDEFYSLVTKFSTKYQQMLNVFHLSNEKSPPQNSFEYANEISSGVDSDLSAVFVNQFCLGFGAIEKIRTIFRDATTSPTLDPGSCYHEVYRG